MAAQGGMRAPRQAPKVLSERDDMRVLAPGRRAATGATAEGAAGLAADVLAGAGASTACCMPGTRGRRGLPAKGASGKSKPKTQSGTRQKTPDEQLVFHDGSETLYRYVELPRRRVRIVRCESAAKTLVVPEKIDGKLVTEFSDGVEILDAYRPVYDIVLLDVEMKHLDGMETARRIRALDADVVLIFITNMAQYAIKGYAVGALDYVLKPVPYFAFSQQLQKAVEKVSRHARHYLAVPVEGGLRRLDTVQIYYLESEGHRVHFYTEDGEFTAPGALKTFEEKLADCPFARCNSGYLVNLAQVRGVQQGVVEVGPYELRVSRPKRKSFLAALADHIGGEGV